MRAMIRFNGKPPAGFVSHEHRDILLGALQRFRHRVQQVSVYVEDTNGPRGGVDKQCRCVLQLKRMPSIVIQDRDTSIRRLLHRVANRASHVLSRRTARRNQHIDRRRRHRTEGQDAEAIAREAIHL